MHIINLIKKYIRLFFTLFNIFNLIVLLLQNSQKIKFANFSAKLLLFMETYCDIIFSFQEIWNNNRDIFNRAHLNLFFLYSAKNGASPGISIYLNF